MNCKDGCLLWRQCGQLCQPKTCYNYRRPFDYWQTLIESGWTARVLKGSE